MEENPACPLTGEHLSEPPRRTSFPQYIPTTANRRNVVQATIDMVPDVAVIENFDFYMTEALDFDPFRQNRGVDYTCARMSKMARYRLWIPISLERVNHLQTLEVCEEDAGYLATLSHRYMGR